MITTQTRSDRAYRTLLVYDANSEREWAAIDLMVDILVMLERDYGITAEEAHREAWDGYVRAMGRQA